LIETIFSGTWNEQYHSLTFSDNISMGRGSYNRAGISSAITLFQEAHAKLDLKTFEIGQVIIDDGCRVAEVYGMLSAFGKMRNEDVVTYDGLCTLRFVRNDNYWHINGLSIPGLATA
jgi:hypothetical protein